MLRTCIDVQVVDELVTETGLGKHAFHCSPDQLGRTLLQDLCRCSETLSTRISGVANIYTVGHLLSLESHLLGVDHDDIVTAVHVRSEARLGLATEDKRNPGSQTSECEISSINDDPLFLYSCLVKVN